MRYFCLGAVLGVFLLSACGPKMYVKHDMNIPVSPATLKRNASVMLLTYIIQREAEVKRGEKVYYYELKKPEDYMTAFMDSAKRNLTVRVVPSEENKKSIVAATIKSSDPDYINLSNGPLIIKKEHLQILPTIAREIGADGFILAQISWGIDDNGITGIYVHTTLTMQVLDASGQLLYSSEKKKSREAKPKIDAIKKSTALAVIPSIVQAFIPKEASIFEIDNLWTVLTANVVDLWDETLGEVAVRFGVKKN